MNGPLSNIEPTPIVPLDYYQAGGSAWEAVVRSICAIAAVITAVAVVFDMPHMLLRVISSAQGRWLFSFTGAYLLATALLLVFRVSLVAGCIASYRFKSIGQKLVVWSSAAIVIFALVQMLIFDAAYYFEYAVTRFYFFSSVLDGVSSFARECFVPIVLWWLFRRTEVRELFRR